MGKTYLITGGAGFLGINLIRFLREKGVAVVSLDIADFPYKDETNTLKIVRGDIRDRACVQKALTNVDIVVHAAAALPLYSKADIFSTDVGGTQNVLEAALENRVERVIFISSTAVYGMPETVPVPEDHKLVGVGSYGTAKIQAEALCLEFRQKGLCVPIVRPKTFIGPERLGVFALLYDWASAGRSFPVLGNGQNRYQLLDVEDLCAFLYVLATADQSQVNDTFNLGAEKCGTVCRLTGRL